MNILFIYPNIQKQRSIQLGIANLSAFVKRDGHHTGLFDTTFFDCKEEFDLIVRELRGKINDFEPDLLAISCRSMEFPFVLDLLRSIKDLRIPNILGGAHPTVSPEEVVAEDLVDMICLGEGEEALSELLSRIADNEDTTKVLNIWGKRDGKVFRNDVRPFIQDLDALPYPDWDLFDDGHLFRRPVARDRREYRIGIFEMSRGCPYSCTYCVNPFLQHLYKGKCRYHREKSVERIIDEIANYQQKYNIEVVNFYDESFLAKRKEKIREFSELYKEKVNLPFILMTRPEDLDKVKAVLMKDAGCCEISMGIESGNERYRREILNRKVSQKQIIRVFQIAREASLTTYSFNMIGLPYENREMIFDTINLNRKVKPDAIQVAIFYPFKGTKLRDICEKEGFIQHQGTEITSYYEESILSLPELSKDQIEGLRQTFELYYRLPKLFYSAIRILENDNLFSRVFIKIFRFLSAYRCGIFAVLYQELLQRTKKKIR